MTQVADLLLSNKVLVTKRRTLWMQLAWQHFNWTISRKTNRNFSVLVGRRCCFLRNLRRSVLRNCCRYSAHYFSETSRNFGSPSTAIQTKILRLLEMNLIPVVADTRNSVTSSSDSTWIAQSFLGGCKVKVEYKKTPRQMSFQRLKFSDCSALWKSFS